jgi:hypothetical protein
MRPFLQVNNDLQKMFDSRGTPSNMRAPGTDTGSTGARHARIANSCLEHEQRALAT